MNTRPDLTPRTIADYLDQLRAALRGADPALIHDALYDAEEHLRAELADQPARNEAEMLAHVVTSYGAPDEVAEIYRDQEIKIQRALRPPVPPKQRTALGKFFSVAADSRTYGALFYMLLALGTGISYFVIVVVGLSLSMGISVLIIGIPIIVLFFSAIRMLSLVEGRIVEAMLGVRMPRRPVFSVQGMSIWRRIGAMFTDPRTWTTMLYGVLMLPLGIIYFTVTVTFLAVALAFIFAPMVKLLMASAYMQTDSCDATIWICNVIHWLNGWSGAFVLSIVGVLLLFSTLHLIRALGYMQGQLAKHLLVARTAKE